MVNTILKITLSGLFLVGILGIYPTIKDSFLKGTNEKINSSKMTSNSQKAVKSSDSKESNIAMQSIIENHDNLEKIVSGFQFVEGPVWDPQGFLLFSDIPSSTIYKLTNQQTAEVFRRPSGKSNGNTLDREGRLITAEQEGRRLTRTAQDGRVTTLVDRYEGKRFNSPNDLVVKSDGSIYFTDPPYGIEKSQEELGFYGVYRLSTDGKLTLLVKDFTTPNGLAFSPDEKKLYISDSEEKHIRVFDVNPDGTLSNGKIFAELKDPQKSGLPDGLKVDVAGNLYGAGPGGVWVFSPNSQLLGKIEVPEYTANLAWGDSDRKTLYITAKTSLYRIRTKLAGVAPLGMSP